MQNFHENGRFERLLLATMNQHSNAIALAEWNGQAWQEITFEKLKKQAEDFSEKLHFHNIRLGERVILMTHNRIHAMVALMGIWLANATAVLIDPDLPESLLLDQSSTADARFIILENEIVSTYKNKINAEYWIAINENGFVWQRQDIILTKTIYEDCFSDIAVIIFTSGTTGDYKGVMLTHSNFIYLTQFYDNLSPKNGCSLTVLPLFHVAGLFCGFLEPLFLGVKIVIFRTFSVLALQESFIQYRPTVLISVPRLLDVFDQKILLSVSEKGIITKILFYFLLNTAFIFNRYFSINAGKYFFKSIRQKFGGRLKKILCGSAQLSLGIQKRLLSIGFEVLLSYGLTETCGPITLTRVSHRWRLGNVGPCVDKNDLKITDQGEIIYGGRALMLGYFRDKKATQEAIQNGFFHTRDLGRLDRFGNLYIFGRIKELIIFSDGKKAMPEKIEAQYAAIPGIKEWAVFSAMHHNRVIAVLAFSPKENHSHHEITRALFRRASQLKSPYRISDVMVVNIIPRSGTLKVKRHELISQFYSEKKSKEKSFSEMPIQSPSMQAMIACFQTVLPDKKSWITDNISFAQLGIDSLCAIQLCDVMRTQLGVVINPTVFWFSHSIRELHDYLYAKKSIQSKKELKNMKDSIAIVALDCVFPGAENPAIFWENLMLGKDSITEIPLSRWNNNDYYDAYSLAPGKTNSRYGGFIELPDHFPYEAFGIKSRIADAMDPQQKILLMLTKRLLGSYPCGKNTGFFLGAGFPDFMIQQIRQQPLTQTNPYSGLGMADFSLCGRVAFHFGLEGPAMVIKTACSSALVAVHQAVRALQVGDCDYALAGGINLIQVPDISVCLTKGGFLSPEGRCKSFDLDANGYVRSEGCGLVLLKRYEDALRDQDNILSVIVGSAINQDGASTGIAAPNGKSQMACYQAALNSAQLSADQIHFVESHGSGTQLGDAIEMQSIQAVYDHDRKNNPLYVGAVKSSIGHCESAAGIAGLIKSILVLQHQCVPPNLHYHKPNPHISFEHSSVFLPTKPTYFEKKCDYAAVSSFGVAGTNAHMIIRCAN